MSSRLKALVAGGLVLAVPYSERPPRFSYELSADGAALAPTLAAFTEWGSRFISVEEMVSDDDVHFL